MSAAVYPPAKVDEKKYRENYDRIFNKENVTSDHYDNDQEVKGEIACSFVSGEVCDRLRAELDQIRKIARHPWSWANPLETIEAMAATALRETKR